MNRNQVSLIAHADWSVGPKKRWIAYAALENNGLYRAFPPVQVIQPLSLLQNLEGKAGSSGCIVVGFDFPIGLPRSYAEKAGIPAFLPWLSSSGTGEWSDFFQVAETKEQISLHRPFYPRRPGGTSRQHLTSQLGVEIFNDLLRECERAYIGRRAACPLFWTMGPQQVGKAALSGWKEVLIPALFQAGNPISGLESHLGSGRQVAIWPFSGALEPLLRPGTTVIVESYPAEFYARLGVRFTASKPGGKSGKRDQSDRCKQSEPLLTWAGENRIDLDAELEYTIREGFGSSVDGEDRFDAVAGLFGMLDVLAHLDRFVEPESPYVRKIEGWIFGQVPGM